MGNHSKGAAIAIALLLILIISGISIVNLAEANPWMLVDFGPEIPGATPPQISIDSPQKTQGFRSRHC
ncbi:MAG: hypothetical protein M1167_07925 [Chloroflexi bacterium]|nr:hypothetical protein [Chloroflexota bacterium]MCL5950072.1 hypothetical protein [Candidatus Bathyarchaeota archaeon]